MNKTLLSLVSAPLAFGAMTVSAPAMAAPMVTAQATGTSQTAILDSYTLSFDTEIAEHKRHKKHKRYKHNHGHAYGKRAKRYRDRDYYDDDDDRYERRRYRQDRRAYYRDQRIHRNTRIWRDRRDGRYYCRRDDGTTGLLIGGAVGGLIGNEVAGRGDKTLGTILGAAGGAILGRAIDRGNYRCR